MKFTKKEMTAILPIIVSDLKHASDISKRRINNANIRRDMYFHVIRIMYMKDRFLSNEKLQDGSGQEALFIKGYVRDIWAYLDEAYDLIHQTNFTKITKTKSFKNKIKTV